MNFLILGMPNVGKSSIYNLLTKSNENIIHKTIGTTRDWHVSNLYNYKHIKIYDTPGVIYKKQKIVNKNFNSILSIIDTFLYVIDLKNKNYLNDIELINSLRRYNKEFILIINKDDNYEENLNIEIFGIKNYFFTSCAHKHGIDDLYKHLCKFTIQNKKENIYNFTIGIFGKTNVGKSTLLNKLVGFNRSIVSNQPKTTTDIVTSFFKYKNNHYLIKDTAGLIKKNKIDNDSLDFYTTKKTLSIISNTDINLFMIDVNQRFDNQSKKILNLIIQKSNIVLIIINKIDLIKFSKKNVLKEIIKDINQQFSQSKNIFFLPISALNKTNIKSLKNHINKLSIDIDKTISTSKLNSWLKKVTEINKHPRIKGKEVKFKYATQVSKRPLKIKIFSNYSREINKSYKNFLINKLYNDLSIKSKNIQIIFSKTLNPYN